MWGGGDVRNPRGGQRDKNGFEGIGVLDSPGERSKII